ncbi:MAG TPA: retropepsin-like aspartic protease [Chitinophagales bacterium]|nr:retropepsin-like aspartic protease [Chitinophagales bacterium]
MKKPNNTVKILLAKFQEGGYHLFISVKVNGKKCRFLIDTGASKSVIDKDYFVKVAGKRNLKTIQQETSSLHATTAESYFGKLKTVEIGHHKIANYVIAAVDLAHVNMVYKKLKQPRIQGILGSDLMLTYKMVVDYGKLLITLP